jgi:hypothetical protein
MMNTRPAGPPFRAGDQVVLTDGTYQGTPGVFVGFRDDVKWADIAEPDGSVRSHPLAWMAHATPASVSE